MWIEQAELNDLRIGDFVKEINRSHEIHFVMPQLWKVVEIRIGRLMCVRPEENPACVEKMHAIEICNIGELCYTRQGIKTF